MIFLLDTNAISDLMRQHPKLDAHLASLSASDRVVTCVIARGEILYGLGRLPSGKRRDDLEQKAQQILAILPCEPVPTSAAEHYATVKLARSSKGLSLDENDLWIVAVALSLGATLVSRDSDVQSINGLTVEDWTK